MYKTSKTVVDNDSPYPLAKFAYVGVQKAASTWLYQKLNMHQEIYLAEGFEDKDTQFFSNYYDRGYEWYDRFYLDSHDAQLNGEVSTSYFPCFDAPGRMARYNPEFRLIVCLRNPVDRLISHHNHEIRQRHISNKNHGILEGIANNPSYIDQSRYFLHLSNWLKHFSLENIHIIIFEELFEQPEAHLQELFAFLGVDQAYVPTELDEKVNRARVPRSRLIESTVANMSKIIRSAGMGWAVDSLKKIGLNKLVKKGNNDLSRAVSASPEQRDQLLELFREENEKLSELLDRDLSIWKH